MKLALILPPSRLPYEVPVYLGLQTWEVEFLAETLTGLPKTRPPNVRFSKAIFKKYPILSCISEGPASLCFLKHWKEHLQDVDIVNTVEIYSSLSYQSAKRCRRDGKKSVIIVWENLSNYPLYYLPPYKFYSDYVKKNADVFIAQTYCAKMHLLRLGISEDQIVVLYPGVDITSFHPISKPTANGKLKILFVGGLTRHKGIVFLLEAFAKLVNLFPGLELTIVGKGPLKREVYHYASRFKEIKYLGYVPSERTPRVYRDADIFCYPSINAKRFGLDYYNEQFGFSVVEAMSSGLPVVATDCGALPEVVGKENVLVKQGSALSLFEGLVKLLRDEGLREELSERNRKRAEDLFDMRRQGMKLSKIMEELVA